MAKSSLTIVPTAWASTSESPTGAVRLTTNVSVGSAVASPWTVTGNGIDVTPGAKVTVDDVAV